jgi:thioredoxin 1
MKNTAPIVIIILLLVAGVSAFVFMGSQNTTQLPPTNKQTPAASEMPEGRPYPIAAQDMPANEQATATYTPFTPELLSSTAAKRRVLFFYASWCPTCRPADESFTKNISQLPNDVTLIRVNYNDGDTDQAEKDLAKKYGVTYQHTFVQIDAQGKEVAKWNGGELDELLTNLQ